MCIRDRSIYLEDESDSYKVRGDEYGDETDRTIPVAVENTFHEQLLKQLGLIGLDSDLSLIHISEPTRPY